MERETSRENRENVQSKSVISRKRSSKSRVGNDTVEVERKWTEKIVRGSRVEKYIIKVDRKSREVVRESNERKY